MTAQTRTDVTMNTAPNAASWISRLSMRPSSQFDDGRAVPESMVPGGIWVRSLALVCAMALSGLALRGLAMNCFQPEDLALARIPVEAHVLTLSAGD